MRLNIGITSLYRFVRKYIKLLTEIERSGRKISRLMELNNTVRIIEKRQILNGRFTISDLRNDNAAKLQLSGY